MTAHLLFPTHNEPSFLPFQRFAESMATSRKKGELHSHVGEEGTTFLRVGRDRRGIAYALSGIGSVNDHSLEPGHAVLLENRSGLSLNGEAGYRVAFASVPRPVA